MPISRSKTVKSAVLLGALGLMGLAASTLPASAHYTTTRCDRDGDRCWTVRCDDDGDNCYRVRDYDRSYAQQYVRPRARVVCDEDGDYCRRVYSRYNYGRSYYARPSAGITFGWHN